MSRYENRELILNDLPRYQSILKKRLLSSVIIHETPEFRDLSFEDLSDLHREAHRWTMGDKFYKLADAAYRDPGLWWVIARFNRMPTESHVRPGEILYIPHPLEQIISLFERELD